MLPADGFYEWQQIPAHDGRKAYKQPYFIHPEDGGVMAFAGLYEEATDAAGRVHPRMPLTIAPDNVASWLDPALDDPEEIRSLLADPAARPLDARMVSTQVNRPGVNSPDLVKEVDAPAEDTA